MNKGIEILLSRMDSNPDEFLTGNKSGKWQHLLEKYEDYMTEEERKAVFTKYHELKMGKFTEAVMKELLEEQEEKRGEAQGYFQQMSQQQMAMQQAQLANAAGSIFYNHNTAGSIFYNHNTAQTISGGQVLTSNSPGNLAFRDPNTLGNTLSIGGETLTTKMLKKLKRLIK
jgi:hypothetical protein